MRKLIIAFALVLSSCVASPPSSVTAADNILPNKTEWQLIGDQDHCKLYVRCVPTKLGCVSVYWSICEYEYHSSVALH